MNANGEGNPQGVPRPTTPADFDEGGVEGERREADEALVHPSPPTAPSDEQPPGF
jgi:hypothetical protein